ncbi:MAG: Stp1/IreP family PP2C-type Ser/Thr phosphatase [Lachnospiraceae bacterium]|nr:Stp1/IreP family PP2C-type Ser/Thr phosphatase [Lachnospiraceae bacterium]
MKIYAKTDIGRRRDMNQDSYFFCEMPLGNLPNLFVVADGMGGHSAGDYASLCTVRTIEHEAMMSEDTEPVRIMKGAIEAANAEVHKKALEDESYSGMGTTVVAGCVIDDILYVANVGDSRLYIINDEIMQITKDHSLVEEMVRSGELSKDEARSHPDRNIITRAVGVLDDIDIDFFEVDLREGDILLLCSDGLTNMVEEEEILKIVSESEDLKGCADRLIKMANHNGGKDNVTVILVDPFYDEVEI